MWFVVWMLACRNDGLEKTEIESEVLADRDADGDGYLASEDCDDSNPNVHPYGTEVCDGVDNDCDDEIDEGVTSEWYADEDADGFGNPMDPLEACSKPEGYVGIGTDCDDSDVNIWPGNTELCDEIDNNCNDLIDEEVGSIFYLDSDLDGYGVPTQTQQMCWATEGWVDNIEDCDDENAAVNPSAVEVCDEVDNNCNTLIDEGVTQEFFTDADEDGFGDGFSAVEACELGAKMSAIDGDCDDIDPSVYPGADEYCDGTDNNCDGVIDENTANDALLWYQDSDSDGYGNSAISMHSCAQPTGYVLDSSDCVDSEATIYPAAAELCDGLVNACGGVTLPATEVDGDGDGYVDCTIDVNGWDGTTITGGGDCDDADATIYPTAVELCDGLVNACGTMLSLLETDDDGDGYVECAIDGNGWDGVTSVVGGQDCNDAEAALNPATVWYIDSDGDGSGDASNSVVGCQSPSGYVLDSNDCNDTDSTVSPTAVELCDGQVNQCGSVLPIAEVDNDGDGYVECTLDSGGWDGSSAIIDGEDCNDADSGIHPGADEYCGGVDYDCDGQANEASSVDVQAWYFDGDIDGYGTGSPSYACQAVGSFSTGVSNDCDDGDSSIYPGASELCDGVDNDCDNQIDEGVIGSTSSCSAVDCAQILQLNPLAVSDQYSLDYGTYYCDMTTDGGGWTKVGTGAHVYGTGYTNTQYNTEGFYWSEVMFTHNSGSAHAHCTYPESMTGCNPIGMRFGANNWASALNWGSSICSLALDTQYANSSSTSYLGGYTFSISRTLTNETIRIGMLEGIASCTISDNPGSAYLDIWVR